MTPRQSKPKPHSAPSTQPKPNHTEHTPTKKFSPIYPFTKNVGAFTISLSTIKLYTIYLKVVTSGRFHEPISYNFSAPTQQKAPPFSGANVQTLHFRSQRTVSDRPIDRQLSSRNMCSVHPP